MLLIEDRFDSRQRRIVTEQQRKNAEFALFDMWPAVPKKNVIGSLITWRGRRNNGNPADFTHIDSLPRDLACVVDCKTVACFGGWVAINPYFNKQGVQPDFDGAPIIKGRRQNVVNVDRVCNILFGVPYLFNPRNDNETGGDHAVVTKRLRKLIKHSVVR